MIKTNQKNIIDMRILFLEDNTTDSDLVCRAIEKEIPDASIDVAKTLKEATHFLHSNVNYQAAILDVNLPDGSGLELLMNIRSMQLKMTVIVLTAYGDEEITISAMKAGADDFVLKSMNYFSKLTQSLLFHQSTLHRKIKLDNELIHVLYTEHHEADLDLAIRHFSKYAPNFKIEPFKNGDELLAHLNENKNNIEYSPILLIDYRLPGLDGLELTKTIRQELKLNNPIVIITGQGNEEIAIQALKLGVDDYIVKRDNYVLRLPSLLENVYQKGLLEKQQKALQESEKLYRLLAENADDVIFTLNMDLNYTYVSPSIYKLRGFTPEEVINTSITNALSPESYKKVLVELQKALHPDPAVQYISTGPISLEFELPKKDKSKIWVEIKASLLKDENSIPYGVLGVTRDITEKKQAQLELYQSHNEYKTFFEDDLTGDYIATVDGKLLNCNPAYLKILGLKSKEEALSLDLYATYPSRNDRELIINELRKHGKLINHEFKMRRNDGKLIYVIANITGIFNEHKELVSLRGYLIDNTARKIALDELHKISQAIKQSPTSILITNLQGDIEYVNPKYCEISGYSLKEVIGKNPRILKSGFTPVEEYKDLWKTIEEGKDWQGEFLNKRKDGSLFWEHASISAIKNTSGEIINYLAVKEDVTERKRLENIQEILVNISNAVLISDTLESFSKLIFDELSKMIDTRNFFIALYDEQTQMISTPFIVDALDEEITEFASEKTLTGYVIKEKKSILINKEIFDDFVKRGLVSLIGPQSEVWIGVPLFSKNKAIGAIVIQNYEGEKKLSKQDMKLLEYVAPQISLAIERKKAVEDLKAALEKAEASNRLKTAFLNNISHEIRTPLNGILGFAPFIIQPDIEPEEKEMFLNTLNKSGERLMNTVTDYMDISLLVSGNMEINPKPVNINLLLEEIHQKFKDSCVLQNLKFEVQTPEEQVNFEFISDDELVKKIITHLLSNAIKFTDNGFVKMGYSLKQDKEQAEIELFVKDSGKGISDVAKALVFETFRQENDLNTRAHEGSGLGLSISKGLVSLLGGSIQLDSEENKGTSIVVSFPIEVEASFKESKIKTTMEEKISAGRDLLIAEDDDMNYLFFETVLRNKFANIYRAENGQDAIELCKDYPSIGVVLMDIKMPGMDGLEATRQIKLFRKELPIIAVTAFAMHGDEKRIREAGCDDYLSKPVDKNKLVDILSKYIVIE